MHQNLFGTDGIRGRFGYEPITPETLLKLGWATGMALREEHDSGEVVIGKDTRVSGYLLESALTCGLSSAGVNVCLLGPVPTPAVSYFAQQSDAIAGIVISASHNPFHDNGIKLFCERGKKLSRDVERRIEELLDHPMQTVAAEQLGKARRLDTAIDDYADYCLEHISVPLSGIKLAVDCANGACYKIAPQVLTALGAEVHITASDPDGFNINENCGSTNPEHIQRYTQSVGASLGIAFDGDGDRVIFVNESGNIVDGDLMLYVLAIALKGDGRLNGGVVGTDLSNIGVESAIKEQSIPFERVQVGDKYISERLLQNGWNLGGEPAGHILMNETGIAGDGLITALEVLSAVVKSGKTLTELTNNVALAPQVSLNQRLKNKNTPLKGFKLENWPKTHDAVEQALGELANAGRIVVRASGTEPIIRVLVESANFEESHRIANHLLAIIEEEASSIS